MVHSVCTREMSALNSCHTLRPETSRLSELMKRTFEKVLTCDTSFPSGPVIKKVSKEVLIDVALNSARQTF